MVNTNNNGKLSLENDIYPLLNLAIPLTMTGLINSGTWFFETMFLSKLGEETLAANSLVTWLFGTLAVIIFGTLSSINILVAHKHGAKQKADIYLIARDGILLSIVIAFPAMILFWNMADIFVLLGQPQEIAHLAQTYLHALSWGLIANFAAMACLEVLIGVGYARLIMVFSVITVTLNVAFSYIFIFGKFGLPALGIAGAGWGMTISSWGTFFILAIVIMTRDKYSQYFRGITSTHKPVYLYELLQVGVPMGLMYCVEVAFFFALALSMGIFGTIAQAANQIAMQFLGVFGSMMFAMAQAITVRMGHLLGDNKPAAAERSAYIGTLIGICFVVIIGFVYWLYPLKLIAIDLDMTNPANFALIKMATSLLAICALFQISESARISLFGALRALKETRFTLLISIVSFWFIALPLGYILATKLHVGPDGFWWGMFAGASISVVILFKRFKTKIHYYQRVHEHQ